jgi:cytochrome P450
MPLLILHTDIFFHRHETTSCVMAWALYELAQRPKLAQRLRQEIKTVIGDPGTANVDANKIDSLELLHCFVMEVLRFYPPVSFLPRTVVNDVVICDHYLPRGTVVYMSLIGHNRSKTVFGGDAEEFRPERWMADGGGSSQTASAKNIHTFGHGARGCLGRDYATRVLKCFTAVLVSRFEMEPVPGHVVEFRANSSTLRPKGELPLRIRVVGE